MRSFVSLSLLCLCAALAMASPRLSHAAPDALASWSIETSPASRFVAVHGRRAGVFGYSDQGLEIWAYPIQVVDNLQVSFRAQNGTTQIDGRSLLRRIEYSPETVTRIFVGPDFVVREKLFVPLDLAGAVLSYEVLGAPSVDVIIRFNPVLNLMWPGSIGGQEAIWRDEAAGYLLSEPLRRYSALITSPDIVAHDATPNAARRRSDTPGIGFTIRAKRDGAARVAIVGSAAASATTNRTDRAAMLNRDPTTAPIADSDPITLARELQNEHSALEKQAALHYRQTLQLGLQIETPDPEVNRALASAQIALEQAWVCNTDLGCGQVAGYGPSRKARRPQYNWFFAGDGMIATRALLAAGRHERAREQLEFILQYQDRKTGMIWHELSQSAGAMDWHKYPYMFGHVDLSYDFLEIVADYYTTSGDLNFLKKHWTAIESAYRYCRSLLDAQDGLPRIPSDKQGSNEQDVLSEELTLSAGWIAASESFAMLAKAVGRHGPAKTALAASEQARRVVNKHFWDEQRRFWISGLTRAGAPLLDRDIRAIGVVKQGLFSPEQRGIALDQIASADFQTDWGTRGKAVNDPTYDPHLYASGSVWAIGTAGVTGAFWAAHRPVTAFPIWSALIPWNGLDSPGHLHETLAGDFYRPGIESVPEQTWSSASFLTTTVQDLIGLHVDATARRLQLAPHLPAHWDKVGVQRVRVGDSVIALSLAQSVGEATLQIHNDGSPIKVSFDPELPLGATAQSASIAQRPLGADPIQDSQASDTRVAQRPVEATITRNSQDTHARFKFDLPRGETTVRIVYTGGVALIPPRPRPVIGEPSRTAKVVSVGLSDRTYSIEFDHLPSEPTRFELRTPWKIATATGAEIEARTQAGYSLLVKAAPDQPKPVYQRAKIVVTFTDE